MKFKVYGYARVSSKDQNASRQTEELISNGVPRENIILDKISGKDFEREGYQYLKRQLLRDGDILYVKSIDRLGRNKAAIKAELEYFRSKNIRVKILDLPTTLIDDSAVGQEWVFDLVNNILIEVLGAMAEAERKNIKQRQAEGISCAKKNGVKFGRPRLLPPEGWYEIQRKVVSGEIRAVDAMKVLSITKNRYYHLRRLFPYSDY